MKKRKMNRITGRLLSIFMAAVMTAGMVYAPVYAVTENAGNDVMTVEQGDVPEEGYSSAGDVTEEDASAKSRDEITEGEVTEADTESVTETETESESISDVEEEISEDIDMPEETVVEESEESTDSELLGETETIELSGEVAASELTTGANYILTGDAVILLADGVEKTIGTIKKTFAESRYTLTIRKASESDRGNGRLKVSKFDLNDKNNQVIVEGGIVESKEKSTVDAFTLTGGEFHSAEGIRTESAEITGGFLDISDATESGLYAEGEIRISGGTVRTVSKQSDAIIAYQDLYISGGTVSAYALAQGTSTDCYGIKSFFKGITITNDAVVLAKGAVCAMTSGGGYHITIGNTLDFVAPTDGMITKINNYEYTTYSDGNKVPEVKIAPTGYTSGIKTDDVLDFGVASVGYEEVEEKSLIVTNKSSNTVNFILPESVRYDISADGTYTGIVPDGSVTFKIKPKTGLTAGNGNELITIRTDNGMSADVMLALKVGYFLYGNVTGSSIQNGSGITYDLIDNATITLSATDNIRLSNINCSSYDLVIKGSDSGKLNLVSRIIMNSEEASLKVEGGTVSVGSISGKGNVIISGGSVTCTVCIQMAKGCFSQSGGSLTIMGGNQNKYTLSVSGDISITGGTVDVNNTVGGTAIESKNGSVDISHATVKAVTVGTYGIAALDGPVNIGAGSKIHAKGSDEAIYVKGSNDGKIIYVDPSLTITVPAEGRIGTSENAGNLGRILDKDGNRVTLVKIVDEVLPVTIAASPATLDFGKVPYGYKEAPAAQELVISNTGESAVSLKTPAAVNYDITTTDDITNIPSGGSVTFSVRPKKGIAKGAGNETLEISTSDDSQSIEVELQLTVDYLLNGEMEAGDLAEDVEYKLIGDTTLHVAAGVNKKISRIFYDDTTNKASLTITGDDTGMISVGSGLSISVPGDVTIMGGTIDAGYQLNAARGKVNMSGGKISTKSIAASGDINISGGTVTTVSSTSDESFKAKNVTISGGDINANSTVAYPVINASENVTITGGKTTLTSDREDVISAKNITIGGDAVLDARTTATGKEALALKSFTGGVITVENTVNTVIPAGGQILSSGTNAGHFGDGDGNLAGSVRFYPVVLAVNPKPVDFSGVVLGYIPDEKTVTVTNTDSQTVVLNLSDSENYILGELSKTTLASGESASFTVKPNEVKVTSSGSYNETIRLKTDKDDIFVNIPVRFVVADPGDQLWITDIEPQTYTGTAITPEFDVYYQGHKLMPADYTVKYSGNTNVSRNKKGELLTDGAKITVTGKGNFAGKVVKTFTIMPRNIGEGTADPAEGITVGKITVTKNSKATPIITYGGYKLGTKDYTVADANKKYTESGEMTVTGKGNFTGSLVIPVEVVEKKADIKTLTITADTKSAIIYDPDKSEDDMKAAIAGKIKVYKDKQKTEPAAVGTDYIITYPANVTDTGAKNVQIIGIGDFAGATAKKITVKPRAVKTEADGILITNAVDIKADSASDPYVFSAAGVTLGDDLNVSYKANPEGTEHPLELGKDYTVSYKNNKAVSTDTKKATYTISFTGNYKGTPALKNTKKTRTAEAIEDYTFTIGGFSIAKADYTPAAGVRVEIPDVVYGKKADLYKSVPFVEIGGVTLAPKNYTVEYYKDTGRTEKIDKNNKIDLSSVDSATVYVTITAKGNYTGTVKAGTACQYKVLKADTSVFDLSKARVTIYQKGYVEGIKKNKKLTSVSFNGSRREINDPDIDGVIVVEYKLDGKNYTKLKSGEDYSLVYVNNVNKGKATLIVEGTNDVHDGKKFIGSKKTTFNIGTKSVTDILKDIASLFG